MEVWFMSKDFTTSPLTNQGVKKILVWFRDVKTGSYDYQKEVTRAFLAKMYHEQRVTHALNGVPVVDVISNGYHYG